MKKILFFLFVSIASFGQINITFPFEKSVFQRNINNTAKLDIAGNFASFIDKVEAKFTPVSGGVAIDWTTIQTNPQNGIYKGSLDVQGGWYTLEVRGSLNGQVVTSSILSRVGIGEVFLIAGQSNAQGLYNSGAVGSADERVICVNNYSNFTINPNGDLNLKIQNFTEPTLPTFETITGNSTIAPMGRSAWCWGKLGDLLTQRLNVPVLFFNVALEGQNIPNWKNTADGQNVVSPWNSAYNQGTYPYLSMKTVINYYLNTYGIRSVLWHQGEADSYFNTPPNQYIDDLKFVINKSRSDFGKNIPWVISRVSYQYSSLNSFITDAQNQVIGNTNAVFSGPNTDAIQVPRPDGVHFDGQGLIDLASAWNTSLDQSFFANAIPVQGTPLIPITATCNPTDIFKPMTYTGLGTYSSYNWSDGGTSPNTSIGIGAAYLKVKDSIGNVSYSHAITNNSPIIPSIPVISVSGSTSFCSGSTVTLTSNYPQKNTWSTGSNTNAITVGSTNNYSVSHTNVYGCKVASLETPVVVYQTPSTPTTNITGVKSFCISNLATLKALGGSKYLWSVGQTTDSILVNTAGTYSVKAISAQGCESLPSPSVTINYNPIPVKPTLTTNGNTSFCAGQNVVLTSSDVDAVSYLWNNGANTKSITINQTGDFSVKTINAYGCASNSSGSIITQANPLPISPTISANSSTTICNGDNVVLKHNSILPVSWSTGIGNAATISVIEQGVYSARSISSFGCFSLISNTIPVTVKPVPVKPSITTSGSTSFCAGKNVVLTSSDVNAVSYLWNNAATTKSITVTETGTFNVKTINSDGCASNSSGSIITQANPLPISPTISANSSTTICNGDNVVLKHNSILPVSWSTGIDNAATISVTEQGVYSVRSISSFGCFSLISNTIPVIVKPVPVKPSITTSGSTSFCIGKNVVLTSSDVNAVSYLWNNAATTKSITVTETGTFNVKTINSDGCFSLAATDISTEQNPLPPTPTVTGNGVNILCQGEVATLKYNSVLPVTWSTGAITSTIPVTRTDTYTARVTDVKGCVSLPSTPLTITFRPVPAKPTIKQIGSFTLQADPADATRVYEWKYGSTILPIIKDIIKSNNYGIYTLRAANKYTRPEGEFLCYSEEALFDFNNDPTFSNSLGVYPNPSIGTITVETQQDVKNAKVTLYRVDGAEIFTNTVSNFDERKVFDLGIYGKGTYIIRVKSADFDAAKKIIIE